MGCIQALTQLGALKDPDTLARKLAAVVTESSLCAADSQATLSDLAALRNAFQVRTAGGVASCPWEGQLAACDTLSFRLCVRCGRQVVCSGKGHEHDPEHDPVHVTI